MSNPEEKRYCEHILARNCFGLCVDCFFLTFFLTFGSKMTIFVDQLKIVFMTVIVR